PNTAAGRAAAMRPPRAQPRRAAAAPPPPEPKSHKLRWLLLSLALIAAVAVGLVVGYKMIRSNYYVGADNDQVVVMRGLPGSILGYSIHDVELTGCVNSKGELTLVEVGESAPAGCKKLMVSDLKQTGRDQVQKGLPPDSLDKARDSMKLLQKELLPPCPKKESVPQPGVLPTEQPPVTPGGAPTPGPDQPAAPTTTTPAPTTTTVPPTTPQISGENCRVTD
ncbi:hypothetical protein ACWDNU_46200, partial [Amycolatopsis sp. NPDC003676]